MQNVILTVSSLLIVSAAGALAAEATGSRGFETVAPYLDEQTIAVGCVDTSRIDLDAVQALALRFADSIESDPEGLVEAKRQIAEVRKTAGEWIESFRKAGGTRIFLVLSIADIPERELPFLVIPAGPDADLRAITGLLVSGRTDGPVSRPADGGGAPYPNMTVERVGSNIFAGSKETLERVRSQKPAALPELAKAFEAAGDAAVRLALAPTPDARRVFEEMLPELPGILGGGPVTAITRGFRWLAVGLDTAPALTGRLLVQSQSAEAAQDLRGIVVQALDAFRAEAIKTTPGMNLDKICKLLTPEAQGDRLTLALTDERINALLGEILTPSLRRVELGSRRVQSMHNMKQLMTAIYMYGSDHKNNWPENLQTLIAAKLIDEKVLVNPLEPRRKDAYVYIRPSQPMNKIDPRGLVVYEAHDEWGEGVNVAFGDGHVEFIADQARFKEMLAKATTQPVTRE